MTGRRGGSARGAKSAGRPTAKTNRSDEESENKTEDRSVKAEPDNKSSEEENEKSDDNQNSGSENDGEGHLESIITVETPKNISFDCSMCFFTTDSDSNFLKHIEELHRRDMGFWCKACGSAYESSGQLIEHIREFCDKVKHYQHACGFSSCEFKTHDPANLIFHFRNEHKGKYLFPCGQCEQQFTILTSLVLHQQRKCSNKDMCALSSAADLARTKVTSVKKEKESNSSDKRFRCALCTFETVQQSMFVEHHTDLHMRDLCCCKRCGKVFKNADNLANHIDEDDCVSNQFEHPCGNDDCDFTTHDPLAYRNHIRNGHARTSLHKCDGCKKQFTIIPLLLMHIQEECPELNTGKDKAANSSNGNQNSDTIHSFGEPAAVPSPPVNYARRGPSARRGGNTATRRVRGRAVSSVPRARRTPQKRGRSARRSSSEEESDVDDPESMITPSRTSSRVSAKKVTYSHASDSDDDY